MPLATIGPPAAVETSYSWRNQGLNAPPGLGSLPLLS